MPTKNFTRTFPDLTLEREARAAGAEVTVLWELRGPPGTMIDWMVGYMIDTGLVIVQTYALGNGWGAFPLVRGTDPDETIADVLKLCRAPVTAAIEE